MNTMSFIALLTLSSYGVFGNPPTTLKVKPNSPVILAGTRVKFKCDTTDVLVNPSYKLFVDGKEDPSYKLFEYGKWSEGQKNVWTKEITGVGTKEFYCEIGDMPPFGFSWSTKSPIFELTIVDHLKLSVVPAVHISSGTSATLTCSLGQEVKGFNYDFSRDGNVISQQNATTFTIASVQTKHSGLYTCTARMWSLSGDISFDSGDLIITVVDPPVLSVVPSEPTIPGGSHVTLTCSYTSTVQYLEYRFYQDKKLIHTDHTNTMEIPAALFIDSGNYTCESSHGPDVQSNMYTFIVQDRPTLTTDPPEGSIMPGDKIVMTCSLTKTKPGVTYSFFRGTELLQYDKTNKYVLKHAEFSISGDYVCTARYGDLRTTSEPRAIVILGCPMDFPNEDYKRRLINSITPKEETRQWGKPGADTQKNGKK